MFGVHIPSISDVKNAVTGGASTALHTTEDLGSSAVSHAASLGRSGLDLGRTAVNAISHADVQKLGSAAIGGIGKAEHWAESGVQTGVFKAGQGVHAAANYARDHVPGGDNPIFDAARGAITAGEDMTRFDIGVVGGVGKATVGLVGSVGQLSVLATEYQVSPSARQAIDAKVVGGVAGAAKSVAGYADSVSRDPTRVFGDAAHVAGAAGGWAKGEVKSAEQTIKDGHGPESFGMQVGDAATYLIPVGGEARIVAEAGDLGARGLVDALGEEGARTVVRESGSGIADGAAGRAIPAISDIARAGIPKAAERTGVPESKIAEILETPKGARPAADTYLSPQYRAQALAEFDDGAVRITSKSNVALHGSLGPPQGAFVMPAREFADVADAAGGDLRVIEQKLGLRDGQLSDGDTLVALIDRDQLHDLDLPSGNEAGANENWLPGGVTSGGVSEGVVDFTGAERYTPIDLGGAK